MSDPRKHHYLPQWYLTRWARPSVVWDFSRRGPMRTLTKRYRYPAQTGYEKHLYTIADATPENAATIEKDFLQKIDDRGAKAIASAESGEGVGPQDKTGLVQFVLSLLHRTPDRIKWMEDRLRTDLEKHPYFEGVEPAVYRDAALWVMADLIQSEKVLSRFMSYSTFFITLGPAAYDLLTTDRPLLLSNGLEHDNAFVMVPVGPRRIMLLTKKQELANHIAIQDPKVFSKAINEALVVQAKELVISSTGREFNFVNERLGVEARKDEHPFDEKTGLVRWSINP